MAGKWFCGKHQCEASCHLLPNDTWCLVSSVLWYKPLCYSGTYDQMSVVTVWGLMCTICYTCTTYTLKSEYSSQHQWVCYLILWHSFAVYMPVDWVKVTTYAMHSSKYALSTLTFLGFRRQNGYSMSNKSHSTMSHRQIYSSEYYSVKCRTKFLHIWQVRCAINLLYVEASNESLKNVYQLIYWVRVGKT